MVRAFVEAIRGKMWAPPAIAVAVGASVLGGDAAASAGVRGAVVAGVLAAAAWLARRGRSLVGPVLAWSAVALVAASPAPPQPAPIADIDRPLARRQPRVQRLRVVDAGRLSADGLVLPAQWLASCAPALRDCRARRGPISLRWSTSAPPPPPGAIVRVAAPVHPSAVPGNPGFEGMRRARDRRGERGVVGVRPSTPWALEVQGEAGVAGWFAERRLRLRRRLVRHLSAPSAAIVRGLGLGDRGGVAPAVRDALRATGTSHVLAVSGAHVGVVAGLVLLVLGAATRRLPTVWLRRVPAPAWQLLPALAAIWSYVALAGSPESARRAGVMASCALVWRALALRGGPTEALALAYLVAVLRDPGAASDVGLQLSCLGVLGALWGSRVPGGRLRQALHVSFAAWALTSWVAVPTFGALPLTAPIANLVVVPLFGLVLLPLALLTLAVAALPEALAVPGLAGLDALLTLALLPLEAMARLDAGWWPQLWPALEGRTSLAIAPALGVAAWRAERPSLRWSLAASAVVTCAFGVTARPAPPPDGSVRVHFLDVGHGDCTLIRFADGATMLVDAGGEVGDDGRVGARSVVPALRALGVDRVDVMVVSHPHPDHENGLLAVARALPVGELWSNGEGHKGREHRALRKLLAERGTPHRVFGPGVARRWRWAGVGVDVVWPRPPHLPFDPTLGANDNSLVLRVDAGGAQLLLAGDVEHPAEAMLARSSAMLTATVLKVPHHGSRTSSTMAFLARVQPQLALAGARPYGALSFPHAEVRARYAALGIPLWTSHEGAVELELGPDGVRATQVLAARSLRLPSQSPATTSANVATEMPAPRASPGAR